MPKFPTLTTEDKMFQYTVTTAKRVGYSVVIVSEYSLPNMDGDYQRVVSIAECGNSLMGTSWGNAEFIARCFRDKHDSESKLF